MEVTSTQDGWLRVVPLGGLGHIGGNMMVYETAQDLVVVDVGVLFPTSEQPGVDYIVPDPAYITERLHKLRGIVITHGHEDHIGALPHLLSRLPAPIYATRFTAALIKNKLSEREDITYELRLMDDRKVFELGGFSFDPLAVTHSIPHAVALAIRTPIGTIVHTGDFKIDPDPLDGRKTDIEGLRVYGEKGVAVLLSDSTNSEKTGHSWSEREIEATLREVIARAPGRVFLTTFSSHIDRVQAIIDGAKHAGRKIIPIGRSMQQNIAMAMEMGILRAPPGMVVETSDFPSLGRREVVVLAAGSQGEPMSSMARISQGKYNPITVDPGDLVIMSSRRIPGNERAIGNMINNLIRLGADVIGDHDARVHTSGHGFNEEQLQMLSLCRPEAFVPLHGELRHMKRHGQLAVQAGVKPERVMVTEDGHPLEFKRIDGVLHVERLPQIQAGILCVDGKVVGDVGEVVLRDRRLLSENGIIVCVVVLASDGHLVSGPDFATRGVIHVDENLPMLDRAAQAVRECIKNLAHEIEITTFADEIRGTVRRFFRKELERRPLVVPIVLRLPGSCCE